MIGGFQVGPFQTNYQQESGAVVTSAAVGHVGRPKPWEQRWRRQLIAALDAVEEKQPEQRVPRRELKAIKRALAAMPNDAPAVEALREELDRLVTYRFEAPVAMVLRNTLAERLKVLRDFEDDDDVVILLLH